MHRKLTSCFGLGKGPLAPGTWGSVPPAVLFGVIAYLAGPGFLTPIIMSLLCLLGCFVCIRYSAAVIAATGESDPGEIVADELAGQSLTFVFAGAATGQIWTVMLSGFLLFRIMDIVKPWPVRKFERLKGGWGVLTDDLMAGVYAGLLLIALSKAGIITYISNLLFIGGGLSVFQSVILGMVQGLTEFLPVSSSGHLVLLETLFEFQPEKPEMLFFDLAVHIGTVIAILIAFRESISSFFHNLYDSGKYAEDIRAFNKSYNIKASVGYQRSVGLPARWFLIYKKSPSVRLLVLGIFATFVTAVCGLLLEDYFTSARGSISTVSGMWVVTGTLLLITDWRKRTRMGLRSFTLWQAGLIGLSQAAAIMPGISRSGATICTAILLGLRRRWAVEFSFLIAIPAIVGATVVKIVKDSGQISASELSLGTVLVGMVTATMAGVAALKLLMKTTRKAKLKFFAIYCYILAALVMIYFLQTS